MSEHDLQGVKQVIAALLGVGVEPPAEIGKVQAALDAALSINHGDAPELAKAAIVAGDAEAARAAALEAATPLTIDREGFEDAANVAMRSALKESDTWKRIASAYAEAGAALTTAVKLVDKNKVPLLLASAEVREATHGMPGLVARVDSLAGCIFTWFEIMEGLRMDAMTNHGSGWRTPALFVLVRDERSKRRVFHEMWTRRPVGRNAKRISRAERLVAVVEAGGVLQAPQTPVYVEWDIPAMVGTYDPLKDADAAQIAKDAEANKARDAARKWDGAATTRFDGPGPLDGMEAEINAPKPLPEDVKKALSRR